MIETITKTAWIFPVFPGEAKMCLGFMSFRAPPAAHHSPNMQPIITENTGFLYLLIFQRHVFPLCVEYDITK